MLSRHSLLALLLSAIVSPSSAEASVGYAPPIPPKNGPAPPPHNACNPMPDQKITKSWVDAAWGPHGFEMIESMCACMRTQQRYAQPHYTACSIPKPLQVYKPTAILGNCACFEHLFGLDAPQSSLPKPSSSSPAMRLSSSALKPPSSVPKPSSSATRSSTSASKPPSTTAFKSFSTTSKPPQYSSIASSVKSSAKSSLSSSTTKTSSFVPSSALGSSARPYSSSSQRTSSPGSATETPLSSKFSVKQSGPTSLSTSGAAIPSAPSASPHTSSTAAVTMPSGGSGGKSQDVAGPTSQAASPSSASASPPPPAVSSPSATSVFSSVASNSTPLGSAGASPSNPPEASPSPSATPSSTASGLGFSMTDSGTTMSPLATSDTTTSAPTTSDTATYDYLPGSTSTFDGPYTLAAAPTATLTPAPPYGVDQGSPSVLMPQPLIQLWYGAPANASANTTAVFARLNVTYLYPAVALDHSMYINKVTCSGSSMTATFNSSEFYSFSQSLWIANATMLWITAAPTCDGDSGSNVYFLCDAIACNDAATSCTATGTFQDLGDVLNMMDADFGAIPQDDSVQTPVGTGCGAAPAPTISGLPAIACAVDFDKQLDDAMGYYSGAAADIDTVMAQFAPTPAASRFVRRLSLKKAWNSVKSAAKSVATVAAKVAQNPAKAIISGAKSAAKYVAKNIGPAIKAAGKFAVGTLKNTLKLGLAIGKTLYAAAKFLVTGKFDDDVELPFNLGPPEFLLLESPFMNNAKGFKFYEWHADPKDRGYSAWANALEVISQDLINTNAANKPGVEFWCVNCGLQGDLKASGHVHVSTKGLEQATLSLKGSMYAGIFLGVNAFATYNKTYTKPLFVQGLPGLSIPKVFSVGPYVELDIRAEARIDALGQAIAGGSINWPAIDAVLDMKNSSNTRASGFKPAINATIQTTKQVTLTLSLGLPITLAVGVNLLEGKYKTNINLTDTPALVATARYEEDSNTTFADSCTTKDITPATQCHGVAWNISAVNDVTLGIPHLDVFNLLHSESPQLAGGCIGTNTTTHNVTTVHSDCPDVSNSTSSSLSMTSTAPVTLSPATSIPAAATTVTSTPVSLPTSTPSPGGSSSSTATAGTCTASPSSVITNGAFNPVGSNVGFTVMPQPWTGAGAAFYFDCSSPFSMMESECFGPDNSNYVEYLCSQDDTINEHVATITNPLSGLVVGQPYRLTVSEAFSNSVACIVSYTLDGEPFRSFKPDNTYQASTNQMLYVNDTAWFVPTADSHALGISVDCPYAGDNGGYGKFKYVDVQGPYCAADLPASAANAGCPSGFVNGPHDNNEVLYNVACSANYGGTFLASAGEPGVDACMSWCNSWGGACQSLSYASGYCTLFSDKGSPVPGGGASGVTVASKF